MEGRKPQSVYGELQDTAMLGMVQEYGRFTIPYITAPILGPTDGKQRMLERDASSIGAMLVNTLASKLIGILFPVSRPFFQVEFSEEEIQDIVERGALTRDDVLDRAVLLAKACHKELFSNRGYSALMQCARHLIVTGNACLYRDPKAHRSKVYGVSNFVVQRNTDGDVVQAIIREDTNRNALPEALKSALAARTGYDGPSGKVTRYWWLQRRSRGSREGFQVREFLNDYEIKDSDWYPAKQCPWIFPVWNLVPGEHYAHGHVEDYASDFRLLSRLSAGSIRYALEMTRVLYLIGGAAGTQPSELQNKPSGSFVRGDPNQLIPLELPGGGQKLAQIDAKIEATVIRLSKAFMYTGATRDAERVTAYELQRNAQEAESLLGGVYSTLTGELQAPLAYLLMSEVDKAFDKPLLEGSMWPKVLEGVPSLGQSNDIENLLNFAQQMAAVMPVVQLHKEIDPAKVANLLRAGNNLPREALYFSPAQIRANDEAMAANQAAEQSLLQAANVADQSETIQHALGG